MKWIVVLVCTLLIVAGLVLTALFATVEEIPPLVNSKTAVPTPTDTPPVVPTPAPTVPPTATPEGQRPEVTFILGLVPIKQDQELLEIGIFPAQGERRLPTGSFEVTVEITGGPFEFVLEEEPDPALTSLTPKTVVFALELKSPKASDHLRVPIKKVGEGATIIDLNVKFDFATPAVPKDKGSQI